MQDKGKSRYVSVDLTKAQKEDMKKSLPDAVEVMNWVHKMCEEGYRFTLRWDDWTECHSCFVYPDDDGANAGLVLTGRGTDTFSALRGAVYRHFNIFDGHWGDRDHVAVDDV